MKAKPDWELERVILLESATKEPTVEMVTSLHADTIVRRYPHLIVRVSPGRIGMKMKNALAIADGTATPFSRQRRA